MRARLAHVYSTLAKRRFLVLAAVVALAGASWGAYTWGRDLSVFEVRNVTIEGVSGRESNDIRRALRSAAKRMTTLHVDPAKLEEAVDSFQAVRSVRASTDFPNSMTIEVVEWRPVAALLARDGRRVAVAGGGTILRGVGTEARLPVVKVDQIPASASEALQERDPLRLVQVLAVAPHELTRFVERAYEAKHGIEIVTRDGVVLQFGDSGRPAAKWAAAARVLADPAARGAGVIDVRVPERPAVREEGGAPGDEMGDNASAAGASDSGPAPALAATGPASGDAPTAPAIGLPAPATTPVADPPAMAQP